MADNDTLPATGDIIRSKDRSGVKTQIVGLDIGIGGSETLMSAGQQAKASSVPVVLASDGTHGVASVHTTSWTSATVFGTTDSFSVQGYSSALISISLSGTGGSGLIKFRGSNDGGTTYGELQIANVFDGITTSGGVLELAIVQQFQANIAGLSHFQIQLTNTLTGSGTMTITITPSMAAPRPITTAVTAVSGSALSTTDIQLQSDNGAFTDGSTKVRPAGYIFDEVAGAALTENDVGASRMDAKRAQVLVLEDATTRGQRAAVSAAGALKVDASGVAVPITDNSGSLTVDAPVGTPVFVSPTPGAGGGWSMWSTPHDNSNTALTNSAKAVKASAGTLGGYIISNPNTTMAFVQIFDVAAASVTLGTTRPNLVVGIPAQSTAHIEMTAGIKFATAIAVAATTTDSGSTAPTSGLTATFLFI